MGSRVRVVNVTRVHPAAQTGDQSPPCHGEYKLSFLDLVHIGKRPIQRLFFFDGPDLPPFPSIVSTLRSSLAATLAVFLPLAGKLAFRAGASEGGDVVVDCSPDAVSSGVRFVEAELFAADDMRRLARNAEHDTDAFEQLVPELDAARLPAPVLAVQVTGDGRGGAVALGVAIHHAVADGHAVWQFMRAWSTVAREGSLAAGAVAGLLPTPTFDRAGVRHPKGGELARTVLRLFAPELPLLRRPPPSSAAPTHDTAQQSRRTFVLRATEIQTLKQRILQQQTGALTGSEEEPSKPPSTYVAVTSLVWTSLVRAKAKPAPQHHDAAEGEDDDASCYFMVSADCRRRLRPPLGDGFFGNCVTAFYARARRGDLRERGAAGLARAAKAIQDAVREHLEEDLGGDHPLSDFERFLTVQYRAIPRERVSAVGSSHRFAAYETDFGWCAPTRVELVSLFARELVTLLGAREEGAVQVSVALDRAVMEDFAACFVVPSPASSDGE